VNHLRYWAGGGRGGLLPLLVAFGALTAGTYAAFEVRATTPTFRTLFCLGLANLEYANQRFEPAPATGVTQMPPLRRGMWFGGASFLALPDSAEPEVRTIPILAEYRGGVAVSAWVDNDADGDLAEESPAPLTEYTPTPGARSLFVRLGVSGGSPEPTVTDPLLVRVVLDPAPHGEEPPSYRLQRVYAPVGSVALEGVPRWAVVWDGDIDGRFTDAYGDGIFVDVDGDGFIEVDPMSVEFGPFSVPFTLGGRRYRTIPLGADGSTLEWTDLGPSPPRLTIEAGTPAPAVALYEAEGRAIDQTGWPGHPVLLHFWASWCGACASQVPGLLKLYASAHPGGLQLVGISCDDRKDAFDRYVAEHQLPWPNAFEGRRIWDNAAAMTFQVRGVGMMVLIGTDGKIDGKYTDVQAVRQRVEEMLRLGDPDVLRQGRSFRAEE
jgi:thiol-disulfide isomerase/thioredoxin